MAITQDGDQAFGLSQNFFLNLSEFLISESLTENQTSSRVDLNNGNGEPLGAKTVLGRTEISATLQVGSDVTFIPYVGNIYYLFSKQIILTEVSLAETQSDYRRYNVSGYVRTNPAHVLYIREDPDSNESIELQTPPTTSLGEINVQREFQIGGQYAESAYKTPYASFSQQSSTFQVTIPIDSDGNTFNSGDSSISSGCSFVTAQCNGSQIKFNVTTSAPDNIILSYALD